MGGLKRWLEHVREWLTLGRSRRMWKKKKVTQRYRSCMTPQLFTQEGTLKYYRSALSTGVIFWVSYLPRVQRLVRCREYYILNPWFHCCPSSFFQEGASHIRVSRSIIWSSIAPLCKCTVIKIRRSSAAHVIWSVYQYWPITTAASCSHSLTNNDKTVSSSSSFSPWGWSTGSLLFDRTPMCALRPSTGFLWIHCLD